MSRDMRIANADLFLYLDSFAALDDDKFWDELDEEGAYALESAGETRWVSFGLPKDASEDDIIQQLWAEGMEESEANHIVEALSSPHELLKYLTFESGLAVTYSPQKMIIGAQFRERPIALVFGFQKVLGAAGSAVWSGPLVIDEPRYVSAGILASASEGKIPVPNATRAKIKDVIDGECSSTGTGSRYLGHDASEIVSLFPSAGLIVGPEGQSVIESFSSFCFEMCLRESRGYSTWLDNSLIEMLTRLVGSRVDLPHAALAWSVLAHDPRQLFMELYRCLEATYAHTRVTRLRSRLGIDMSWDAVATILHQTLRWRATESEAIKDVVASLDVVTRDHLASAFGSAGSGGSSIDSVAKSIYDTRNAIVHFRPGLQSVSVEDYDWCAICSAMVLAVLDRLDGIY